MTIWFGINGTLADFYNFPNYGSFIKLEDPAPFIGAKPLWDNRSLTRMMNRARRRCDIKCGIIDVMPPLPLTKDYAGKIASAKFDWLKLNFPTFNWDYIKIVNYTCDKFYAAGAEKGDILIEGDPLMRRDWTAAGGTSIPAFSTMDFFRNHNYEVFLRL